MFKKIEPKQELYNAALEGNIEKVKNILEKYKEQKLKPDSGTLAVAIKSGCVPLVQYLNNEHKLIPRNGIMEAVDTARSLEMVQYLMNTYPSLRQTIDNTITWAAARTGNLEMLKFFLQRKFFLHADEGTLYDSVRSGNLDMVKYLVDEYGLTDVTEAYEFAIKSEKKEISVYLQEKMNLTLGCQN